MLLLMKKDFLFVMKKENVRFTTPTQQEHNTSSHEGGVQYVGLEAYSHVRGYCVLVMMV